MINAPIPTLVYIGVDVSSQWLDVAGLRFKCLPNTPSGYTKFLRALSSNFHVILEASGGYEQAFWLALLTSGAQGQSCQSCSCSSLCQSQSATDQNRQA